ncbi:integrase [Phreatobacter sp. HK31-P]
MSTVPLPPHVNRVEKANGRIFHYFAKHRRRPDRWPPVRLPDNATDPLFWTRAKLCERLYARKEGDRWAWSFMDGGGTAHALPDPKQDAPGFWAAVEAAEERASDLALGRKTFRALVDEYRSFGGAQPEGDEPKRRGRRSKKRARGFLVLAPSTQEQYGRYLDRISSVWGDARVADLTTVDVQAAIDAHSATPRSADLFRAVLSVVLQFGIPRGYCLTNVAEASEKIADSVPYEPWPDWAIKTFFACAPTHFHLPVISALYTGQRSVDVMKMVRPAKDATEIDVFAQKTGVYVPILIHADYRAMIADLCPADAAAMHLKGDGEPWTLSSFKREWQRLFNGTYPGRTPEEKERRAELRRIKEAGLVFHGLRKNAVILLREAGIETGMVSIIVGMSEAMVNHYAAKADTRRAVREAQLAIHAARAGLGRLIRGNDTD